MRLAHGLSDRALAHAILRITFGLNFFIHGIHRIPVMHAFAAQTVRDFDGILPAAVVTPYAETLPYVETIIGALLILGLFQRATLAAGAIFMATLTFGTALRNEYNVLAEQLGYELTYFVLLATREWDGFSLDAILYRRSDPTQSGRW